MKTKITTLLMTSLLCACTSMHVNSPDSSRYSLKMVCIERNDKVQVADFTDVIQAGFLRHGIETALYDANHIPASCSTVLKYTARRGWDVTPFMNYANLVLVQDGRTIGTATYEHKGGLALNKWAGTATKMDPVIDALLTGYQPHSD